ncbi:MAG: hypothetical protein ACRDRW_21985 [Pseudonocardiaceae bacterium]
MGKHDQDDEDEQAKLDGFVGWMPRKPERGKHAAEDEGNGEEEGNEEEDQEKDDDG